MNANSRRLIQSPYADHGGTVKVDLLKKVLNFDFIIAYTIYTLKINMFL